MTKEDTYYVMVEPTSKTNFRPCVIEYGLTFERATAVMRRFIMDHGLWFKVKGEKRPARIHIYRTSETLPENYFIDHSILGVKL